MILIERATVYDYHSICAIGMVSVREAHKDSAPEEALTQYLEKNYSHDAIKNELTNTNNIYHIISYEGKPVGFSKINLNARHPNISGEKVTKLDRIYLLKEFYGLKIGYELLKFNIELAKTNQQSGIWLFTWVGNKRAIDFYNRAGFKVIGSHYFHVTPGHSNLNHHMLLEL